MPIGQSKSMFTMGASQYPTLLPRHLCPPSYDPETDQGQPSWSQDISILLLHREERGVFQRSYERGHTGVSYAEVFFIEKPDTCVNYPPPSHLL